MRRARHRGVSRRAAADRRGRRLGNHGRAARGRKRRDRVAGKHRRDRRGARHVDCLVWPDQRRPFQSRGHAGGAYGAARFGLRKRSPSSSRRSPAVAPAPCSPMPCSSCRSIQASTHVRTGFAQWLSESRRHGRPRLSSRSARPRSPPRPGACPPGSAPPTGSPLPLPSRTPRSRSAVRSRTASPASGRPTRRGSSRRSSQGPWWARCCCACSRNKRRRHD